MQRECSPYTEMLHKHGTCRCDDGTSVVLAQRYGMRVVQRCGTTVVLLHRDVVRVWHLQRCVIQVWYRDVVLTEVWY